LLKINEIWYEPTRDELSLDRVLFKLNKIKRFMKGWGFNLSGARKKRKQDLYEIMADLETMEEVGSLDNVQLKKKVDTKVLLLGILEEEELY
jgi:argonaute-like protein implicated in RNA metabolism and viral defense